MNDPRRFPWLSGLVAAIVVALWLIAVVIDGVMGVIDGFAEGGVTAAADHVARQSLCVGPRRWASSLFCPERDHTQDTERAVRLGRVRRLQLPINHGVTFERITGQQRPWSHPVRHAVGS